MSRLFSGQTIEVLKNELITQDKKPINRLISIATNISCRITGTHNSNAKLFISKINYDKIPGGLHKNYVIEVKDYLQRYKLKTEPIWAGGIRHHIEVDLEESV